jgi:hypothetical protein
VIQGPVSDRTTEALGATDVGIILFRRMLDQEARVVEDGGDPMNVRREEEEIIVLPVEHYSYPGYEGTGGRSRALRHASQMWLRCFQAGDRRCQSGKRSGRPKSPRCPRHSR